MRRNRVSLDRQPGLAEHVGNPCRRPAFVNPSSKGGKILVVHLGDYGADLAQGRRRQGRLGVGELHEVATEADETRSWPSVRTWTDPVPAHVHVHAPGEPVVSMSMW